MKKCLISVIAGALAVLIILVIVANLYDFQKHSSSEYRHIDYVSEITNEDCFVCSETREKPTYTYWGEDNIGIINLNTFDLLYLQIKRYDDYGTLVEELAGYVSSSSIIDDESGSYAHAYSFPDNNYASVQIHGVQYDISRNLVQNQLCQNCLDSINTLWLNDNAPAEYAVISFEDRTIRPLVSSAPWFSAGNYGVDCEFGDDGQIKLLVHYLS